MLATELDEDEKRITDTCIIYSFVCVGVLFVAFIIGGVICILMNATEAEKHADADEKTRPGGTQKLLDVPDGALSDRFWKTFEEVEEYCKMQNAELPAPKSQIAEDDLLDEILNKTGKGCKRVFLGYKANLDFRYKELNGTKKWPSLKVDTAVGVPTAERDCVYMNFTYEDPEVMKTEVCGNKAQTCLLYFITGFFLKDFCYYNPYSCGLQLLMNAAGKGASIENAYNKNYTMMLLDPNNLPLLLQFNQSVQAICVALAVTYQLKYEYNAQVMTYESNKFTLLDPENDCLAFDIPSRTLVTASCFDYACPVCTRQGQVRKIIVTGRTLMVNANTMNIYYQTSPNRTRRWARE